VLEGCGFVGIVGYMYSCDTRQQQQYFIACICARTDISASLVTPHASNRLALSVFLGFQSVG
jgi:hypothetical protein